MFMTSGANKAITQFNSEQERQLSAEAFEARNRLIETVYTFLDIALQENKDQYANMQAAFARGKATYTFDHYVVTSDQDEHLAQRGEDYRPTILLRFKNVHNTAPSHQVNSTTEIIIAIPTQDDFTVDRTTDISDIDLSDKSIYVYWNVGDDSESCHEISAEGVRKAQLDINNAHTPETTFDFIYAPHFAPLDTAAALVARLRQDLRNLDLVPHFRVTVDASGSEISRQT